MVKKARYKLLQNLRIHELQINLDVGNLVAIFIDRNQSCKEKITLLVRFQTMPE